MPIRPPKLDDRKYADIVREARTLIPQYCPEWTNLGDADPGMTLVQLFAWMTEMTIFRLNRVPDKTYVHFLNFIGEERRRARPATVPLTFGLRAEDKTAAEIPSFSRCVARPEGEGEQLQFLTTEQVTVHGANVTRIVSVNAGPKPMVREIPFEVHPEHDKGLLFNDGRGVSLLEMDAIAHGPRSYTPQQYLYVAHDDFRLMDFEAEEGQALGRLRIRSATADNLPVGALFKWEYFTADGEQPWRPVGLAEEEEEILGLPEIALTTHLPGLQPVTEFGDPEDPFAVPKDLQEEKYWLRGTVDYERWLAHRMQEDLEIAWRDDRGAEERPINNWEVRATGRNLEFFIQDMPPIRGGWTVQFTMVDRSMPAGKGQYLPRYRWLYRRRDQWEEVPADRVRYQDTSIILTGPLTEMATDGYNLRAERIETVHLRGFIPELDLDVSWMRPVELYLGMGPETGAAVALDTAELPVLPFQPANTLPPLLGMKFFIGSDLFENRAQQPVLVELEVDFEWQDESIPEPDDLYHMQLCYRAVDTWRVVYDRKGMYNQLTFKDLDEEGALKAGRRKVRFKLNPKTQLKDLHRAIIGGQETTWLRLELTKAQLTKRPDKKSPPLPVTLKIYSVKLGVDGVMGKDVYEQPLPGPKMVMAEYRKHNRRLTRTVARVAGRLSEDYPFDTFIDVEDAAAKGGSGKDKEKAEDAVAPGHQAIYFQLDKPLPIGQRHAILFKCRGETFLPDGLDVSWELLEDAGRGRSAWARLTSTRDGDAGEAYTMNRSGTLAFSYPEAKKASADGHWMRVLFRMPRDPQTPPALPPVSHMMLNTVEGVNLHAFRMERFSGLGVPHQTIQLRRYPIYLHGEDGEEEVFDRPERFPDLRVFVTEGDGTRREWRKAPGNSILMASKDDRVFIVDPVDGTITFGNGIRGKMVPAGTYNIAVEVYHTVPGTAGNVSPGAVTACDGYSDVVNVTNLLPATGGRNSESIEEIIRRAPSVLTSRDRAVTRLDFEIIAREASAEVARAACSGNMGGDGEVEVVVLPRRREGEIVPDPFLAAGLKDHVQQYLARRCLVNVRPVVRLATFRKVDVSLVVRLRENTNLLQVRDRASSWIARFLDPYFGGLDGVGWPFGATLYAEDFGRMVTDIPEVRHIVDVQVYGIDDGDDKVVPGWEAGRGTRTLVLDQRDLFQIRRIRVRAEGVE